MPESSNGDCFNEYTNRSFTAGAANTSTTLSDCFGSCGECQFDCADTWNGTNWESDCGCVAADNSGDDCDDCFEVPFGDAVFDDCGVCGGNSSSYAYFDILNVVALVDAILENTWSSDNLSCSDVNDDGVLDIADIVIMVESILGSARFVDASEVTLIQDNYSLSYNADGFVGGLQITLSHGNDFDIELTANSMVSDYRTAGNFNNNHYCSS